MTIEILLVKKYDQERYNLLLKENLENEPFFIPSFKLNTEGDLDYRTIKETIRIGAFDDNQLIGLLHGSAISKNQISMDIALVEEKYRMQGVYTRMLQMFLQITKKYDEVVSYHHIFY